MISLITTLTAALFAALLFNQYQFRRAPYQLAWAIGAAAFAVAAAAETLAGLIGWSEPLYRSWYLTGAVWTAGWLGTGTVLLLSKTRFGYWYSACLVLAGFFTILVARRLEDPTAGPTALFYALLAWSAAVSIAWLAYLGSARWSRIAVGLVLLLSAVALPIVATAQLPAPGWATDPQTGAPVALLLPPALRLLTPLLNISGAFALLTGALFSAYVFMPKVRALPYSSDPRQRGDEFLFNLAIAPFAIAVNFMKSLPLAFAAWRNGTLNRRVPATLLIALGAFFPSLTDTLSRTGSTEVYQLGKALGALLLLIGFLASVDDPDEITLPLVGAPLRAALRLVRGRERA